MAHTSLEEARVYSLEVSHALKVIHKQLHIAVQTSVHSSSLATEEVHVLSNVLIFTEGTGWAPCLRENTSQACYGPWEEPEPKDHSGPCQCSGISSERADPSCPRKAGVAVPHMATCTGLALLALAQVRPHRDGSASHRAGPSSHPTVWVRARAKALIPRRSSLVTQLGTRRKLSSPVRGKQQWCSCSSNSHCNQPGWSPILLITSAMAPQTQWSMETHH